LSSTSGPRGAAAWIEAPGNSVQHPFLFPLPNEEDRNMSTPMDTLYQRLGGEAALDAAVDRFYDRVLADARIRHFFSNTDMARQRQHQKQFLSLAFGGPAQYDGRSLRAAHQHLVEKMGLDESHFDAVVDHLAATLGELGVAPELIDEVAQVAASIRDDMLCR
jgi:hemoglobin